MNIRIKDIARLSGVSVSTVSKIMNNKADSIAESTKARVLQIAREHHYSPYASIRQNPGARHYILGLLSPLHQNNVDCIRHLEAAAGRLGYNLLVSAPGGGDIEDMERNLRLLIEATDGLIIMGGEAPEVLVRALADNSVPAVLLDVPDPGRPGILSQTADWDEAVQLALEHLAAFGHRRIGLLLPRGNSWKNSRLKAALERFYSDREMVLDHKLVVEPESLATLLQVGATALVCADLDMAALFYKFAWQQDVMIPHEISVMALSGRPGDIFSPPLATVITACKALADNTVEALCALIEDRKAAPPTVEVPVIVPAESVTCPESQPGVAAHILVVGSLNVDVVMKVPQMPSAGDLVLIDSLHSLPGGKGANQALGVAKLGGEVSLIGRIGRDLGGRMLYSALRDSGVNTRGISVDRQVETGRAYINVDAQGESFIEVYGGANQRLEKRHLERNETLFRSSRYCLVQSELPRPIYTQAVEFAARQGALVIFKPAAIDALAPEVLEKIHILVPNQKEAARLAGMEKNIEEQADFFLARGVDEVIITLAEQGCFHCNRERGRWYPAYEEPGLIPVDTSGASDAFISALAVSLAEGQTMETAIRFAQVAAGLSICQQGVQSAMPDRGMLELRAPCYLPK